MVPLEKASKEIVEIINKYLSELKNRYLQVNLSNSEQGVYLTCLLKDNETITFRAIPDNERSVFIPPRTNSDYQKQGGHKTLIEKMNRTNPNAWKIEVKQTMQNKVMEIGFFGNEMNWDIEDFEKNFVYTFKI